MSAAAAPDAAADAGLAPECEPFVPCGGSLLGKWRFESTCDDHAEQLVDCDRIYIHGMQDVGTIEFEAAGTYQENDTFSEQETDTEACPGDSCAAFQVGKTELYETNPTNTTRCLPETSLCACDVSIVTPLPITGSYAVSGSSVTLTNTQIMPWTVDYCVTGDELVIHSPPDPSSLFGGGSRLVRE
jgi:hypothetical protein